MRQPVAGRRIHALDRQYRRAALSGQVTAIDRIKAYNDVCKAAAAANGFQYLDAYALSQDLIANGRDFGGIHISKDFVTGGFFAYGNAVHASNIGYSILADELIKFINTAYGTSIPRPDMSEALFTPDVPAPGTTGIGATVGPDLLTGTIWRAFSTSSRRRRVLELAFPAETDVRTGPRSSRHRSAATDRSLHPHPLREEAGRQPGAFVLASFL